MLSLRIAITGAVLLAAVVPSTASAGHDPVGNGSNYSFKKGDCRPSQIRDPITVEFVGSAATTKILAGYERGGPFKSDVDGEITRHIGWKRHNTDNLFRQSFSPFDCVTNPGDTDLATTHGYGRDRKHLRMWQKGKPDMSHNMLGLVELTPHVEDWYWHSDHDKCGGWGPGNGSHAVERGAVDRTKAERERKGSGFDRGRRRFYEGYAHTRSHRHEAWYWEVGNTRSIEQCDEEYAGSNGTMLSIGIGRYQCPQVVSRKDCHGN